MGNALHTKRKKKEKKKSLQRRSSRTSTAQDEERFPFAAVRLSFLREWCTQHVTPDMTTKLVCDQVVLPLTKAKGCAATELEEFAAHTGPATTTFVSHCWRYDFTTLVETLCESLDAEEFVWIDVLSVNQHNAVEGKYDQEWWSKTFHASIQKINNTVIVFSPWDAPISLSRAWCVWELWGTIRHDVPLRILLHSKEKDAFVGALTQDFSKVVDSVTRMDTAKAEAFDQVDRDMIAAAVKASVGFEVLNDRLLEPLRAWMLDNAKTALCDLPNKNEQRGRFLNQYAKLLHVQGEVDEAVPLFREAVELLCAPEGGADEQELATAQANLALAVASAGKNVESWTEALDLATKALEIRERIAPWLVPESLNVVGHMMCELGDSEGARERHRQALSLNKSGSLESAVSLNYLGAVEMGDCNFKEAVQLFSDSRRIRESKLGTDHPDVALALCNEAMAMFKAGDEATNKESENLLRRAVATYRKVYGAESKDCVAAQRQLDTVRKVRKPAVDDFMMEQVALVRGGVPNSVDGSIERLEDGEDADILVRRNLMLFRGMTDSTAD